MAVIGKFFVYKDTDFVDEKSLEQVEDFYEKIPTLEKELGQKVIIHEDKKSKVNFIECHISSGILANKMDLDAVIDPSNQEDYRANRMLQPKNPDFLGMVEDAKQGRQFSDIVIEYSMLYRPEKPLKILGGQHRSVAIRENSDVKKQHGIRVYFNLDINKRVELYKISNTNIQVPEDLIDRLEEQSLTPPGTLREFAHEIKLLKKDEDFGEKRSSDEPFAPTVRMLRTFIVNFYKGKNYKGNFDADAIEPYLCTAGGKDPEYMKIFNKIPHFKNETDLLEAGKNFVKLHTKQFDTIDKLSIPGKRELRVKALSLSVISSWACAAGLLQRESTRLQKLYKLPDLSAQGDPLNAIAMSKARLQDVDPENYRGLGTRTGPSERGRVLQLLLEYSNSPKPKITLEMCNAAIKIFQAQHAKKSAEKSKKKAFG